MGFWDFLVPAELPYPGMPAAGNGGGGRIGGGGGTTQIIGQPGNGAAGSQSGVLDKIFAPADLPYPLPVVSTIGSGSPPSGCGQPQPQPQPQPALQNALICLPTSLQAPQPVAVPQPIALPQPTPQPIALPTPQPVGLPQPTPPAPAASSTPGSTTPVGSPAPAPSPPAATPAPPASAPSPSAVTVVIAPWPMPVGQQSTASCPSSNSTDGNASGSGLSAASGTPALPANGAAGATTTNAGPSAATAPAGSAPSTAPASAPTVQATPAAQPVAQSLILPCPDDHEKRLTSYCTNPRLRARTPKAQDVYLEDVLGEVVTVKMLSKDAAPVAFAVPDGTDAVEITIGPIEVDPDHGSADDLDQVVTIGELQIDGIDENGNTTGDQVTVTAPWRYASFVELAPDHLRFPIYARFFSKILPM